MGLDNQDWNTITNTVNTGAAAIAQSARGKKAHKRSKELMGIQMDNQMKLNDQGSQLQLQQWKDTNVGAQMKMIKEAGLNPALMYGKGGAGGATTGSQSGGSASAGQSHAPMDIGAITQAALAASQMAVNKSQANKNDAEASSISGNEGTVGASVIGANEASALNNKANAELTRLGYEIGNATREDQIDSAHFGVERIIKENNLTDKQAELARVQTGAVGVRMQLDRANIKVSEETAKKIANDIVIGWKQLDATLMNIGIGNQGNKLRALEGKTRVQSIKNDFIISALGKNIDLMKLNVEQQKIFANMFNGLLGSGTRGVTEGMPKRK